LRYIDRWGLERYRASAIPGLMGPATAEVFEQVFNQIQASASQNFSREDSGREDSGHEDSGRERPLAQQPLFVYFSGHGYLNETNADNNGLILWGEDVIDVQSLAIRLDALPRSKPVVVMMAQCFSGSFANLIYAGGDPEAPVALHSRCGFFATTQDLPSVGCTPEVDEADYRDYSSSFFAGLTGIDRLGQPVVSADYDGNGKISYNEAHAFAKIDEKTSDRPVSSLEVWLQRQLSSAQVEAITQRSSPQQLLAGARPERGAVIRSLGDRLGFNLQQSFIDNVDRLGLAEVIETAEGVGDSDIELQAANLERLRMELLDIAAEQWIQRSGTSQQRQILQRLHTCESQTPNP
ncbi:MAG: Caspase domain-containing protein, partial [Synechococcales cyanobacterium RU_4_20]|nr:Caspase domain-containing protein [Synechococcales cyanobacterium RU_4_20]